MNQVSKCQAESRAPGSDSSKGPTLFCSFLRKLNSALKNAGVDGTLDAETFHQLSMPERNVRLKNHIGGPAPEAVSKTMGAIAKTIEGHKEWLASAVGGIQEAKKELEEIKKDILC